MNYKQINEYFEYSESGSTWVWLLPNGIRKIEMRQKVPSNATAAWGRGEYI